MAWLDKQWEDKPRYVTALTGDAGARRYYRVFYQGRSYLAVDSPPEYVNNQQFIHIASQLADIGLTVPEVLKSDLEYGFLLLSDLGPTRLFDKRAHRSVMSYYDKALSALRVLQCHHWQEVALPDFDRFTMQKQLDLCKHWFFEKFLGIDLTHQDHEVWQGLSELLLKSAESQPQCAIHTDYHSRNLMCLPDRRLAVVDFQDLSMGPVTYDIVSLLKDCYITWPTSQIKLWLQNYFQQLLAHGQLSSVSWPQFEAWFHWMGVQRHLKCMGIFARLSLYGNNQNYLHAIPRIWQSVCDVCEEDVVLRSFLPWLKERIEPNLRKVNFESHDLSRW